MRPRTSPLAAVRAVPVPFAFAFAFAFAWGCGNAAPPSSPAGTPGAAGSAAAVPAPASSDLPNVATMPPRVTTSGSKIATQKHDPAWAACHAAYKPQSADLAAEVQKLAQTCASASKMHAVGTVLKGDQAETSPPDVFPLKAEAGHCYRVYGLAEPSITDLDLLLRDSSKDVAGEDSTDDRSAVLLEDGALCFSKADDAAVVLSVGAGKGNYALQVWSD